MNKEEALQAIKHAKEIAQKRNFSQTIDVIFTLRDLDLKKPDNHVDFFLPLTHPTGKETKVCGLAGPEMMDNAKKEFDGVIGIDDFASYAKDKPKVKRLADSYTYFVAQANLMAKVAQSFGRVFGPKGKMPNPKAGCVVPANANLALLKERLSKTIRIQVKKSLHFQVAVGKEDQDEAQVLDNMMTVYTQLVNHLPQEKNNLKGVYVKLTMGKVVKVGEKPEGESQ